MSNVEKYANELIELAKHATAFKNKVSSACGGSFEWGVKEVVDSYLSLFNRFCPFKVGDRVKLVKDVRTNKEDGWHHCRHFLKKGALATIHERGYSNGKFTFHIIFDNETYIDSNGLEHPVDYKHSFHFGESMLSLSN